MIINKSNNIDILFIKKQRPVKYVIHFCPLPCQTTFLVKKVKQKKNTKSID